MTFDEMSQRAKNIRSRAERLNQSVINEARDLSRRAGLSPDLLGIHPHNAWCSYQDGRPWPEVDYTLVRRILWLVNEKQFEPTRLADRIISRLIARVVWPTR